MSILITGQHVCDRCKTDLGNGGVTFCVVVSDLDPDAAEDPLRVFELTDRVRETIQSRLHVLLAERGSPFG